MFGLGFTEIMLIFVIALVVFGPKKLPDIGKSIGRAMADFKKASEEFQESVREEMKDVEKTSGLDEVKKIGQMDFTSQPEQQSSVSETEENQAQTSEQTSDQPEENAEKNKKNEEARPNV